MKWLPFLVWRIQPSLTGLNREVLSFPPLKVAGYFRAVPAGTAWNATRAFVLDRPDDLVLYPFGPSLKIPRCPPPIPGSSFTWIWMPSSFPWKNCSILR